MIFDPEMFLAPEMILDPEMLPAVLKLSVNADQIQAVKCTARSGSSFNVRQRSSRRGHFCVGPLR